MAKVKNHTTRNVRHAKALSMRELDKLWAELVKKRDGGKCVFPPNFRNEITCSGSLDAHHYIGRGNKSTRYLLENGVSVCRKHHRDIHDNFVTSFAVMREERTKEERDKVFAASRILSPLRGKLYADFWHEYLQTERMKLG